MDGRIAKKARLRYEKDGGAWGKEVFEEVIGDAGFADDTAIIGEEMEMRGAERIFVQTLTDWEEKVNESKTEILRLSGTKRKAYDVKFRGETDSVRNVGGWITNSGRNDEDTRQKVKKGYAAARLVAKAWGLGSTHGRGRESLTMKETRLKIMKTVVIPSITTFARSRAWTKEQLRQVQRVANYAVRRCMGMDILLMQEHHVSDEMLYAMSGWETMEQLISKHTMWWLGHVGRMPIIRRP